MGNLDRAIPWVQLQLAINGANEKIMKIIYLTNLVGLFGSLLLESVYVASMKGFVALLLFAICGKFEE